MQPPLILIRLPLSSKPTALFHTSDRIPNEVSTVSTTLPPTSTSARAVYRPGDSGDHKAALRIGTLAASVWAWPRATAFAEVIRETTFRPRASSTLIRALACTRRVKLATFTSARITDRAWLATGVVTYTPHSGIRTGPVSVSHVCR